jgi:hypothetical protein
MIEIIQMFSEATPERRLPGQYAPTDGGNFWRDELKSGFAAGLTNV